MAKKPIATLTDAQLRALIEQRPPEIARLTKAVLGKMRQHLPGSAELVYDKKNSLVIGFCSADRASNAINSIATIRSGSTCISSRATRYRIRNDCSEAPAAWCAAFA